MPLARLIVLTAPWWVRHQSKVSGVVGVLRSFYLLTGLLREVLWVPGGQGRVAMRLFRVHTRTRYHPPHRSEDSDSQSSAGTK